MRIGRAPFQRPDVIVERQGDLYRIERKLSPKETLEGLPELLKDGAIEMYTREENAVVVYAPNEEAAQQLADLPRVARANKWLEKAKEILLPPDMDENVAPEYLKYRAWTLGSSIASGAVSFSNISVSLNALKLAFSSTEKAALAQTVNTFLWRFAYMGGSFLAHNGDVDPRRYYAMSSLISTTNSLATLAILSAVPTAYWPVTASTALLGAMGSTVGSAAGVNVFHHMAIKNKGVVQSKNANQSLLASMMGMPVSMGLKQAAKAMGINASLLTVATMAPIALFCDLKAIGSIRMEPISRGELEKISDGYLKTGEIAAAPTKGPWDTLVDVFHSSEPPSSAQIKVAAKLEEALEGQDPGAIFSCYRDEKYLLTYRPDSGTVHLAFRKDAGLNDMFKAYTQARLLEQTAAGLYPEVVKLKGEAAPGAFVELLHRAMPDENVAEKLNRQGWHASHLKLNFATSDGHWTGEAGPTLPATNPAEIQALAANPDSARLSELLGAGAPALAQAA